MNPGDFLDRWTILRMKSRLDQDAMAELGKYEAEMAMVIRDDTWLEHQHFLISCVAQLAEANAKIWLTEASIRKEYADDPSSHADLSLEEIGRRALQIRAYNKMRIEAKKAIDVMFGKVPDNKVDHQSK